MSEKLSSGTLSQKQINKLYLIVPYYMFAIMGSSYLRCILIICNLLYLFLIYVRNFGKQGRDLLLFNFDHIIRYLGHGLSLSRGMNFQDTQYGSKNRWLFSNPFGSINMFWLFMSPIFCISDFELKCKILQKLSLIRGTKTRCRKSKVFKVHGTVAQRSIHCFLPESYKSNKNNKIAAR